MIDPVLPGILPSDLTPEARDRLVGLLLDVLAGGEPTDELVDMVARVSGRPKDFVRFALRHLGRDGRRAMREGPPG